MITVAQHLQGYGVMLKEALASVDANVLQAVHNALQFAMQKELPIYVCGNGGSAAISQHFACDHSKGVHTDCKKHFPWGPNVVSLSSNISLITAIANDFDYESVFSEQLNYVGNYGVLVAISSSGNSPNIVKAIQRAKEKGILTISFTGFDGGEAHKISDIGLHIPINNYGVVEDAHQAIMHVLSQTIRMNLTDKELETIKL